MFRALATFVLRHRLATALGLALLVAGAAAGALSLQADFSAMAFYGSEDPEVDRLREWKDRWGQDDAVLLLVVTAADGAYPQLVTVPRLRQLDALIEQLDVDPDIASVVGLPRAPLLLDGQVGVLDLAPLIERLPDDPEDEAAFRERILADPLLVPELVAADGSVLAIAVELDVNPDAITELRPAVIGLRERVETWRAANAPDLSIVAAGVPAVRTDFFQLLLSDQLLTVPLLGLVLVILLGLIFRRLHGVLAPALAAAVPTLMVLGVMGWVGEPIGILNQSYFTLLPVIAVADAIHMVSRFHEEVRRRVGPGEVPSPAVRREAIAVALRAIGAACFLTSLTTAVGFGSLFAARMPILRSFGGYAALGIVFAYGTVLLIIPLLLSLSRGTVPEAGRAESLGRVDRALLACAELSVRRPWLVLAAFGLLLAGSGFYGTRVVVDNTLTGLIGEEHPTRKAGVVADERLGGILGAEVELTGPAEAFDEPAVLQRILAIEGWARDQPEVRTTSSPARQVKVLYEALTGRGELPDSATGVVQVRLLAEGDGGLDKTLRPAEGKARLSVRTRDDGGNAFADFGQRLQARVDAELAGSPVTGAVTGTPYVAYRGINAVTSDLRDSLVLALVAVTIIVGLLFRSVRVAFLALPSNMLPLAVGYGLMGFMEWELDPTPAVVFTVALGIAVDDTIHLLARTREEQAEGADLENALRGAVLHSGRAVVITTVLLCIGFGLNALSSFPSMRVLGILGAVVIFVALLGDLFLLPAVLTVADRRRT